MEEGSGNGHHRYVGEEVSLEELLRLSIAFEEALKGIQEKVK